MLVIGNLFCVLGLFTLCEIEEVLYSRQFEDFLVALLLSKLVVVLVGESLGRCESLFGRVYHYLGNQINQQWITFWQNLQYSNKYTNPLFLFYFRKLIIV